MLPTTVERTIAHNEFGLEQMDRPSLAESSFGLSSVRKSVVRLLKQVVDGARRAVRRGRAENVSADLADAQKAKLELCLLLDEMLAESGGPLTVAWWIVRWVQPSRRRESSGPDEVVAVGDG